jgi:transketolase
MIDGDKLKGIAQDIRKLILKTAYKAGGAHMGGSFSAVEILTAIYFGDILKYNPSEPWNYDRDRFILSKGHASVLLYSVLAKAGYIEECELETYIQKNSRLGGHPKMREVPGVEATTGSLGHGLLFATGIALAGKIDKKPYHTYVLIGDGECQEGSVWEAVLFAGQHRLSNLTVILDYNKLQAMDKLENIIAMEPMGMKWKSFNWDVNEVDGHNIKGIINALKSASKNKEKPGLIIAHTTKGKGISFMENKPLWHFRMPNSEENEIIKKEMNINEEWLKR